MKKSSRRTFSALVAMVSVFLLLNSCGGSDSPTTLEPTETLLVTGTIDAAGGSLEHADISLDVPAGAFTEPAELSLVLLERNPAGTAAGTAFRLDGLPAGYYQPLTVRFPDSGARKQTRGDEYVILVGEDAFVSSYFEVTTTYHAEDPVLVGGFWELTLPAMPAPDPAASQKMYEGTSSVIMVEDFNRQFMESSAGHFKVSWMSVEVSADDVTALCAALEEAYDHFPTLGFDYAARTNWPVTVTIKPMELKKYGGYSNSKAGNNYGYIDINIYRLPEQEAIRVTAGHEFFHMVQSFDDPRWSYFKAISQPAHHWLNEAAAAWCEDAFSDDPNFVSATRDGNEAEPFEGLAVPSEVAADVHGYGLAPLISYLVTEHGNEILPVIWDNVFAGSSAFEAVELAAGPYSDYWADFLSRYCQNEFQPMAPLDLYLLRVGLFRVVDESSVTWSATTEYRDLSGKLLAISLLDDNLPDAANMDLTLTGDYSEMFVYSYDRSDLTLLAAGPSPVNIPGLKAIKDAGRNIIILVVQNRGVPDYQNIEAITLGATINRDVVDLGSFTEVFVRLGLGVNQLFGDGTTGQTVIWDTNFHATDLVITGNSFTADMDLLQDFSFFQRHYYGTIQGILSADRREVVSVSWDLNLDEILSGQDPTPVYWSSVEAVALPMDSYWPGASARWQLTGAAACDAVTSVQYQDLRNDWVATGKNCGGAPTDYKVEISVQ